MIYTMLNLSSLAILGMAANGRLGGSDLLERSAAAKITVKPPQRSANELGVTKHGKARKFFEEERKFIG